MKKYLGFTLVEMLVVMGIIILLMAMGIGGGRLALKNASDIAYKANAKTINEGLLAFYSANGSYPASQIPSTLVKTTLKDYIETFDGGNDGRYWYFTDTSKQYALVCVELATDLTGNRDIYCEGNGFGKTLSGLTTTISAKTLKKGSAQTGTQFTAVDGATVPTVSSWVKATPWTN
jgi:type II secretory pathway pseudopilin PulG